MYGSNMQTGPGGSGKLPIREFEPGSLIGVYTVRRFIASGGFGAVYEVEDPTHPDGAALKVLHAELRELGDPFIRFLREGNILELIRHPNVIEVYHSGVLADGRAYLVTELLSGRDLNQHIAIQEKLDIAQTVFVLEPVCAALAAAHDKGVVHRDVKASNVFLSERAGKRRIVLLDFGLAKILEGDDLAMTRSRMALGTPATMSPEQLCGRAVTARTDVYGLGAMTFHMLTGRVPFSGSTRTQMQYMHLHGQRPRPSTLANVSRAVDEVVTRAMARDPRDRPAGPDEFLAELRRAARPASPSLIARRLGQEAIPAVGLLVELRPPAGDETSERAFDELDEVLDEVDRHLTKSGFTVGLEASSFVLFVKRLDPDPTLRVQQRREATVAATQLHELIDRLQPRVHVNIVLHVDSALFREDEVRGGDLVRLDQWAPQVDIDGVIGSEAVFEGLDVDLEAIPGQDRLGRLLTYRPRVASQTPTEDEDSHERLMHSEMLARIGRQTAGIIHDLRSPLNVVLGNLQYAIDQLEEDEISADGLRTPLEQAIQAAEQLMSIVSSVRKAAAINAYNSDQRRIGVKDVVDTALKLAASEIRQKATVDVSHRGDSYVLGIPGRLTQAVVNLLVNAAHAIPKEGGQIAVSTKPTGDGRVEIAIRDNGVGMSEEVRLKIFEPFFTTKDVEEGTGLGLSLVQEIINEHHGTITVASQAGTGSCFTIRLPRNSDPG